MATQQAMAQVWPSPFIITPQFQPTINYSFVSSAELTSVSPETIVYQINPKAIWSDGVPITASDFIYNWHAQSGDPAFNDVGGAPFIAKSTLGYSDINSVTSSDSGKRVTVVFKQPFSDWESLFDPLVPAHIAEKYGWNSGFTSFNTNIEVSGGPYEIASASSQRLTLVRNPKYWGAVPPIATINMVLDQSPSNFANQMAANQIQLIETPAQVNVLQQLEGLSNVAMPVQVSPTLRFEELDFNQADPILSKLAVREALADYTDRNALIAAGPGQMALSEPMPQEDDNHIYVPSQYSQYQPNGSYYDTTHPNQAAKLLTQSGFILGSDGMWHQTTSTGPILTLSLLINESDPIKQAVGETFVSQMKAAGIQIQVENLPTSTIDQDLLSGNWQLAEVTQQASPFAAKFEAIYSTKPSNYFGYDNLEVDQLFQKAIDNPDLFDATEDYNLIDKQLWSDMVSLPLYEDLEIVANTTNLNGVLANASNSTLFWNAQQWSLHTVVSKEITTTTSTAVVKKTKKKR